MRHEDRGYNGINNRRIKAIDTSYKGYLFRSRLEARYAVLFDRLGINWVHEPEGYEIKGIGKRYLPDFLLRESKVLPVDLWVEIKPTAPTGMEMRKFGALVCGSKQGGLMIYDYPGIESTKVITFEYEPRTENQNIPTKKYGSKDGGFQQINGSGYTSIDFCHLSKCPSCGYLGVIPNNMPGWPAWHNEKECYLYNDKNWEGSDHVQKRLKFMCDSLNHPELKAAFVAAKSTRFEFGESQ